jgi:hypothetical protein
MCVFVEVVRLRAKWFFSNKQHGMEKQRLSHDTKSDKISFTFLAESRIFVSEWIGSDD